MTEHCISGGEKTSLLDNFCSCPPLRRRSCLLPSSLDDGLHVVADLPRLEPGMLGTPQWRELANTMIPDPGGATASEAVWTSHTPSM